MCRHRDYETIRENKVIIQDVPRSVYGMRLTIISIPVVNDNGQAVGAMAISSQTASSCSFL